VILDDQDLDPPGSRLAGTDRLWVPHLSYGLPLQSTAALLSFTVAVITYVQL